MSKRSVSICDKCNDKWADYSVSIRSAGSNIDLKLVDKAGEEEKIGPVDLCKGCFKDMFKGIKLNKPEEVKTG